MSLVLCRGSQEGLEAKTFSLGSLQDTVLLSDDQSSSEFKMSDLMRVTYDVLTQRHLIPDDPRISLVQHIRTMRLVVGYNVPFTQYTSLLCNARGEHPFVGELPVVVVDQNGNCVWTKASSSLPCRLASDNEFLPKRVSFQEETIPHGNTPIYLDTYRMTFEDFMCLVDYVLTNSDLFKGYDPRLQFVECVKSMVIIRNRFTTSAKPIR